MARRSFGDFPGSLFRGVINYLPTSGGELTGSIDMSGHDIEDVNLIEADNIVAENIDLYLPPVLEGGSSRIGLWPSREDDSSQPSFPAQIGPFVGANNEFYITGMVPNIATDGTARITLTDNAGTLSNPRIRLTHYSATQVDVEIDGSLTMNGGDIDLNTERIYGDLSIDPNTYIYSDAADSWSFVTGGTERMSVDNSATTIQDLSLASGAGFFMDGGAWAVASIAGTGSGLVLTSDDKYLAKFRSSGSGTKPGIVWSYFSADHTFAVPVSDGMGFYFSSETVGVNDFPDFGHTSTFLGFQVTRNDYAVRGANGAFHTGEDRSSGTGLFIGQEFNDLGNVEVLRGVRSTATGDTEVGYYSSWIVDPISGQKQKSRVASLRDDPTTGAQAVEGGPVWQREWFKQIEPIRYRRILWKEGEEEANGKRDPSSKPELKRPTRGGREIGFNMDNLNSVSRYLTTSGDQAGYSPDEFALMAVTIDYVQYLEERVAALEAKLET